MLNDIERAARLVELQVLLSCYGQGDDSKKRKLAIELLVGKPDGDQTDRLAQLAIMIATGGVGVAP